MAYENIVLQQPNFCLGPQAGTICSISLTGEHYQEAFLSDEPAGQSVLNMTNESKISNVSRLILGPNISGQSEEVTVSSCAGELVSINGVTLYSYQNGDPVVVYNGVSSGQTTMVVKTTAGSTIKNYSLSVNILNAIVGLEYVGPHNLTEMVDGLSFFTFEKITTTKCMIRRWETRVAYDELVLKEQIVKTSSGDSYYDVIDFAVEYYSRTFTASNEKYSHLSINNTKNLKLGTRLFLGPSTDTTNLGATEIVYVSHVSVYGGEERVYLTSTIKYEYASGDPINFYSHVYIYSQKGYAGDDTKGTLFKLDAYSWSPVGIDTKALYKKITTSRWYPVLESVASVVGTNMFFVMPYDSYAIWRSAFLNNVESDTNTMFEIYDIIFNDYIIYKLQKKITLRNDSGIKTTTSWATYNYQQDTILPYTNSINIFQEQSIVTGHNKDININIHIRDQYFVGLKDIIINLYKNGDSEAVFEPSDGQVITDSNGAAVVEYTSGSTYTGRSLIAGKVSGGLVYNGSQYVWNYNNIISIVSVAPINIKMFQLKEISGDTSTIKQIDNIYRTKNLRYDSILQEWVFEIPDIRLYTKSFFMTPGGDWSSDITGVKFYLPWKVEPGSGAPVYLLMKWLPALYGLTYDTPRNLPNGGFTTRYDPYFDNLYDLNMDWTEENDWFWGNRIQTVNAVGSSNTLRSLSDFHIYEESEGVSPFLLIKQPAENGSVQLSQLKMAHHTYWLGGVAYDYLWTYIDEAQFVFVEDAIPKFWSVKNTINTYVWLRLRPYIFSLNSDSLKMWIRELYYAGDSGFVEILDNVEMFNFDAGSGITGIELMYTPSNTFYNNSIIFIKIEVYDTAPTPNFITLDYWFETMPDYRAPYLTNLSPGREDENIPLNSNIYFEIKDDGVGIDINSLEVLLNSRRVLPDIEKLTDHHYKINYSHTEPFYYNRAYKVTVKVSDSYENANRLNDSYTFYTEPSAGVVFTDFDPVRCKRGMQRFQNISLVALADGNGIDEDSIKMQVFDKDVTPRITPIIYRIS